MEFTYCGNLENFRLMQEKFCLLYYIVFFCTGPLYTVTINKPDRET